MCTVQVFTVYCTAVTVTPQLVPGYYRLPAQLNWRKQILQNVRKPSLSSVILNDHNAEKSHSNHCGKDCCKNLNKISINMSFQLFIVSIVFCPNILTFAAFKLQMLLISSTWMWMKKKDFSKVIRPQGQDDNNDVATVATLPSSLWYLISLTAHHSVHILLPFYYSFIEYSSGPVSKEPE